VLQAIDNFKLARNIPVVSRVTAMEIVSKHQDAIILIHKAGRPQSDAFIYIESQEGKLIHAEDTLRKAINRLIKDWRKRPSKSSQPARHQEKPSFADTFNVGGERW
jgi:ATP-dependent protease HslVU (ClpYQ) peptidase subunit